LRWNSPLSEVPIGHNKDNPAQWNVPNVPIRFAAVPDELIRERRMHLNAELLALVPGSPAIEVPMWEEFGRDRSNLPVLIGIQLVEVEKSSRALRIFL
jgi:hypothetical protein